MAASTTKKNKVPTIGDLQKKYGGLMNEDPEMTIIEFLKKKGSPNMAKLAEKLYLGHEV